MTQRLTKEWLQQEISRMESELSRNDAYRLDENGQKTLEAFRLALTGMSDTPVIEDGIFKPGDAVGVFNIGCETCPDYMVAWTTKGQHLPKGVYWLYLNPPKQVPATHNEEQREALEKVISENWQMRDVLRQLLGKRPGGIYFNKWEPVILEALNTPATDVCRKVIQPAFIPDIIPDKTRDQIIDYCEGTEICDAAAQRIWDICRSSVLNHDQKCNGGAQ